MPDSSSAGRPPPRSGKGGPSSGAAAASAELAVVDRWLLFTTISCSTIIYKVHVVSDASSSGAGVAAANVGSAAAVGCVFYC